MIDIRLYFATFCTNYVNSGQTTNRQRGAKQKGELFRVVLSQLKAKRVIRQYPLIFDFTFYSVKQYPTHNYGQVAKWIIDAFLAADLLQDTNSAIIAEIRIRTQDITDFSKEGCLLQISRYDKNKAQQ